MLANNGLLQKAKKPTHATRCPDIAQQHEQCCHQQHIQGNMWEHKAANWPGIKWWHWLYTQCTIDLMIHTDGNQLMQ